jgi:16S rRNA (uracil1498-N3)-methyltransferase
VSTKLVAERLRGAAAAYVLHEAADQRLSAVPLPDSGDIVLVIGPEGGIDDRELAAFDPAVPVRLGAEVLRTSTAGVAAVAVLATRLGRW